MGCETNIKRKILISMMRFDIACMSYFKRFFIFWINITIWVIGS